MTPTRIAPGEVTGTHRERVLVTGGAGFIGSHLVRRLVAEGSEVVVIDDLSGGNRAHLPPEARLVERDVSDPAVVDDVIAAAPQLVIHLAAQVSVPVSVVEPGRDRRVNLEGTELVLRGAHAVRCRRFVFVSSGGAVLGEADGGSETSVPQPASPYGIHKLAAEGYVRTSGLSYGIARPANVYGPRQRSDLEGGVVAIFVRQLLAGAPISIHGTGQQSRDLVYVGDVVDAVLEIGRSEREGVWNVSTGQATTVNALLARLVRIAGSTSPVIREPARAGDVHVSSLSNARIRADLGWAPGVSLDEGLRRTLQAARAATDDADQTS